MNIVLGISGGIAAYKTPELVRRLRERGADVQIVMTASSEEKGSSINNRSGCRANVRAMAAR